MLKLLSIDFFASKWPSDDAHTPAARNWRVYVDLIVLGRRFTITFLTTPPANEEKGHGQEKNR